MMTLRASALSAAHRGETTYEEVLRATTVDTVSGHRCPSCSRALADDMVCCPYDGTAVNRGRCQGCDKHLDAEWSTCPFCRRPTERPALAVEPERLPRLLVVDDDASIGQFVAAALTGSAEVRWAVSAEEGLALVGSEHFDGILVDNGLPDLSGIEMIRLLRTDPRTLATPLVLFTGSDSAEVERAARRAGADEYLAKPMEPLLLEERVLALVRDGRRRAA
jgi:CheY-like chemotaxis protein